MEADRVQEKLWSRNLVLAIGTNLFIYIVFYLLMTSMALYAAQRFLASDAGAGFASSAFIVGALVSRFFAGPLIDNVGRRRILLISLAAFVAASLLYIPAGSLPLLLALRLVHGVAFGLANTAVTAGAQALIPPTRRSEGTGYFAVSTTLATAIGPLMAVLLVVDGNYDRVFLFCAACSVAAMLVTLTLRLPKAPPAPAAVVNQRGPGSMTEKMHRRPGSLLAKVFEPAVLPITTVLLVAGLAYSGVLSFLASYANAAGATDAAALFFGVFAAAVLVSRLTAGRIQDRRGDNVVIYPAMALFAAGLALLALGPAIWVVLASAVLSGLGFGTLLPGTQAITVGLIPEHRFGTALATYYLMLDIGTGLGPVLLGLLVPLTGFNGMYAWLGGLMVACIPLYYLVHGRAARKVPV
ncbi:MFS transporter [Arthrobacter sulfonylureivorans]|uniref:MFS transporter n=1 Tax=Arthrobacter sulfonylureivorans TaxID=2486855 RepID=A0ABY3WAI1_9MICC|nr:MFS transporter [Arthrobacter sulfonylureivorans]UNK45593.1 MFS transporter [Arthrobacter sulfonylureivorans]